MHRQSGNRALVDTEGARNIGLCFARSESLYRFLPLMGVELRRTTETHAAGLRSLPALSGAGADQFSFEFRYAAQERQQ